MSTRLAAHLCVTFAVLGVPLAAAGAPATYQYTGNFFNVGVGGSAPACPQCRVQGTVTLSAPLAPNLPAVTGVKAMVVSFSFTDETAATPPNLGSGLLTNANATISTFGVATDATGAITIWSLQVDRFDQASSVAAQNLRNTEDLGVSVLGNGYDGFVFQPGTWTTLPVAVVPALPGRGVYALAALLLAGGALALRRARAGRPEPGLSLFGAG
jgi:hypothetical protein